MKLRIGLFILLCLALFAVPALAGDNAVKVMSNDSHVRHLADGKGMTLYWFKNDSPGMSACTNGCLGNWPIFYRGTVDVTGGLDAADFGTITRPDGKKQTTFRGYPLYYFAGDDKPGDTNGQGLGGAWFTLDPENFPLD